MSRYRIQNVTIDFTYTPTTPLLTWMLLSVIKYQSIAFCDQVMTIGRAHDSVLGILGQPLYRNLQPFVSSGLRGWPSLCINYIINVSLALMLLWISGNKAIVKCNLHRIIHSMSLCVGGSSLPAVGTHPHSCFIKE